jgi:hypothetical protein
VYTDLIIAEIHQAINKLGGSAQPATPDEAQRALRRLGADVDLRSIVDSWGATLPDEQILHLLRNWNAGLLLLRRLIAVLAAYVVGWVLVAITLRVLPPVAASFTFRNLGR